MRDRLIECVPNVSEGRDRSVITEIVRATLAVGVKLLHVDAGADANRTVVTFAGTPEAVLEGAFRLVESCVRLIDLRRHKGEHPRVGAADVCPFVPIRGVTMEECVRLARSLGKRVSREFGLPVYYYEEAASSPERRNLPYLRQGGFEALPARMRRPELAPDAGPAEPHPSAGVLITGARPILIAYNVHLATTSVDTARAIAERLRSSGRSYREGERLVRIRGLLPACRAIGWYMKEYGCAEVSFNLLDYKKTGLRDAFEATSRVAAELGTSVTGSEVIGLLPREALEAAADPGDPDLGASAVRRLGLDRMKRFDPAEKLIEERLERPFDESLLGIRSS